jgi:hypothetical protein
MGQRRDSDEQVVRHVVHARKNIAVPHRVHGPEDDDAIEIVLLEAANISPEVLEIGLLVVARNDVIGTGLLVGSNEIWVVDRWPGSAEERHVRRVGGHLGTGHGLVHRRTRYTPSAEDEVI